MANENQDDSLYPIAVLIDELRNEDVQVIFFSILLDKLKVECSYFANFFKITLSASSENYSCDWEVE